MDSDLITYLNSIGLTLENGHLYLATRNKCKNNKSPYSVNSIKDINEEKMVTTGLCINTENITK